MNVSFVLVFIVFLILKLTNVIAWSWIWVTSPLWIGAGIAITALLLVLFGLAIATPFACKYKKSA